MKSSTTIPQCRRIPLLLGLIVSLPLAALAQAGDLEPPGAPAPTMRTLDDIGAAADAAKDPRTPIDELPHTIDEPGSYYLAQNLSSDAGGIVIKASNVTLDLMGFTLSGEGSESGPGIEVERMTVTLGGISTDFPRDNITITNGNLHGWSDSGIDAEWAENSRFESLHIRDNGRKGLFAGNFSLAQHVTASSNERDGIYLKKDGNVSNSTAMNNGGIGIWTLRGNVSDSIANNNEFGIITATASNCTVKSNLEGIEAESVSNCFAEGNGNTGIIAQSVNNSTARSNDEGIYSSKGSVINSFAYGNDSHGIHIAGAGVVAFCSANNNGGDDIFSTSPAEATLTGNATSD